MRIVWVSFAPLRKSAAGLTSDQASVRYRLLIPADAIPGSKVTHFARGANRRTLLERFEGAHAVVFGKLSAPALAPELVELIGSLKAREVRVLVDFSDDHFVHPDLGPAYRILADAANRAVASTPTLADVVRTLTATPVCVITDPVEGERGEPKSSIRTPARVLWFGHPTNLDTLRAALPHLAGCSLTVMTAAGAGAEGLGDRFVPWSTAALFAALRECDAVVIPSNPHDPGKAVKSPNRFTEALWAGRFVIAHPLPAYQALAAFGWVGDDLGEGLSWLSDHTGEAAERVRAGQQWVSQHCSRAAVAGAWQSAIDASRLDE